jgi:drug/metabolite transporter (DMT)-like permease
MLLGFIIWNDIPTNKTWLGVLIIIGCGLYLFNKENSFPDKSPQEIN